MQTIEERQELPIPIDRAWDFFSDPRNLGKITPSHMKFEILNGPLPTKIYPGMVIIYRVRPMWNLPLRWVTEITQVDAPGYFIDNQMSGPYAYWHHQHILRSTASGVELIDIVNYKVPYGFVGTWIEKLIVARKVREIFSYRRKVLNQIFSLNSAEG